MGFLTTLYVRFRRKAATPPRAVRSLTWAEDVEHRRQVAAAAEARRAERARAIDMLIGDRPGWLRRGRWLP